MPWLVPQAIGGATGRVLLVVDDPDAVVRSSPRRWCPIQVTANIDVPDVEEH
jgi:hypothetical protein